MGDRREWDGGAALHVVPVPARASLPGRMVAAAGGGAVSRRWSPRRPGRPRFIREESPPTRPASGARGRPFLRTRKIFAFAARYAAREVPTIVMTPFAFCRVHQA